MRVGVLNQLTRCSTKKREKTSCISYYGFSSRIRPDYQVRTEPRTLGHTLVAVVRVYVPPAVYPCNDSLAPSFLASLIQGRMSGLPTTVLAQRFSAIRNRHTFPTLTAYVLRILTHVDRFVRGMFCIRTPPPGMAQIRELNLTCLGSYEFYLQTTRDEDGFRMLLSGIIGDAGWFRMPLAGALLV